MDLVSVGQFFTHVAAFLIFFWVMKTYVWGPVLSLLDERQHKIEQGFDDIRKRQADADASYRGYEEKLRGIDAEARERIQAAIADGQRIASEIAEKARLDAAESAEMSRKKIELEVATARKQLRDEVIKLTLAATERLIQEKLNDSRDRELVGSFISELESKSL